MQTSVRIFRVYLILLECVLMLLECVLTDADDDQDGLAGGWSVGPYIQVSILLECVLTFLDRVLTLLECVLTLLECVVIMLSPNHNILETLQHLN